VVILEMFAGAGGGSHSLRLLGVPDESVTTIFVESGDSHPDAWLHRCLRKSFPRSTILHDVHDLLANDAQILRDLAKAHPGALFVAMGGFPCQDLSSANPRAAGFKGARSILAAVMATVIRRLQDLVGTASVAYLGENVQPKLPAWKALLDQLWKATALVTNAITNSSCARRRLFWTNLVNVGPVRPVACPKQSILDAGWRPAEHRLATISDLPTRPNDKWTVFLKPFGPGAPPEWPVPFWKFPLASYTLDNLVISDEATDDQLKEILARLTDGQAFQDRYAPLRTESRGQLATWIHQETHCQLLRPLNGLERCRALGYPADSMYPGDAPPEPFSTGDYIVAAIAGNGFPVLVVKDILQPLSVSIKNQQRPTVRTEPLKAKTVEEAMAVLGVGGACRR
jgi:site-specific DNA-cytosine methylase